MSRIGKQPVRIPNDVKATVSGKTVNIEGPKGKLSISFHHDIDVELNTGNKQIMVKSNSEQKLQKALHGLTRALISNMVVGVTAGFSKNLDCKGSG